jgi:hypothetical protein
MPEVFRAVADWTESAYVPGIEDRSDTIDKKLGYDPLR